MWATVVVGLMKLVSFFLPSFFEGIFSDLTDRFFLVTWNKRFFGYDRGLFWVFVLGYWSYGEKKFGSWLVFLVTGMTAKVHSIGKQKP